MLLRSKHEQLFSLVDLAYLRENYKEIYRLYLTLDLLFKKFPEKEEFTLDELEAFFWLQYPQMKGAERESQSSLFTQLRQDTITDEVLSSIAREVVYRSKSGHLARIAFEASIGSKSSEDLRCAVEEISTYINESKDQDVLSDDGSPFVSDDLTELFNETVRSAGLRWRLDSLNKRLGSLRKGDFGFIFARPETGKTTWLASECSNFAGQSDRPVLWFNNEEQGSKVKLRIYQAYFGVDMGELYTNSGNYRDRFSKEMAGKILILDQATIYKSEVEKLAARYNPSLIVFDQIDKIKGFTADRHDLELGSVYQWARGLAKEFAPVIGVCQADGTGEGVRWLTMSHVSDAKTSKQAEADWILGIGRQNNEGMEYIRHLHLSKNKLFGDTDSDPSLRHDKWDVIIRPELARYEDLPTR
jgi:replicative DNA helicase